jgi:hypothetical protein
MLELVLSVVRVPRPVLRRLVSTRVAAARTLQTLREPGRIRQGREVRADARSFARSHPYLAAQGPLSGPRALVVSLTDWPYQLKIEGILLKALELAGYRPAVLTSDPIARSARRYLSTYGFDEIVEIERYAVSPDLPEIRESTRSLLDGGVSVQKLKDFRFRSSHVGRQALSSLSRQLLRGSVDIGDRRVVAGLSELLPRAMALCYLAERMLGDLDPEIVVFNEARYAGFGSIFETALQQERNVIQFVHAFSDDALVFKRYTEETSRFHPRSLGDEAWREVAAGPWNETMEQELARQFELRYAGKDPLSRRLHARTRRRERSQLVSELALDPSKPTAVLFSHVLWDANPFYGDDLFEDQGEWLVESIREAIANPSVNWVVKLHLANVWKLRKEGRTGELSEVAAIREQIGELPPHVRLLMPDTEISTVSLFELADWGITIRGTVGVELPCYGVPVITAGTSHYTGRGFTVDSPDAEAYRDRLRRIAEILRLTDDQTLLAKKHAHALFCRRPSASRASGRRWSPWSAWGIRSATTWS